MWGYQLEHGADAPLADPAKIHLSLLTGRRLDTHHHGRPAGTQTLHKTADRTVIARVPMAVPQTLMNGFGLRAGIQLSQNDRAKRLYA